VRADRDCVWAQYTVLVERRDAVQAALHAAGIPTAVHYPKPLHLQPAYAREGEGDGFPRSVEAAGRVLSLPMSADLGIADMQHVSDALRLLPRDARAT
jgi:UDP-2-acetamido-2-deoxy-ribo-hexuluronate aminotransferase